MIRNMLRLIRHLLFALSLALALVLLCKAMWGGNSWSVWLKRSDRVQHNGKEVSTPHYYYFNFWKGRFIFGHWRNHGHVVSVERAQASVELILNRRRQERARLADQIKPWSESYLQARLDRIDAEIYRLEQSMPFGFHLNSDGSHWSYHEGLNSPLEAPPEFLGVAFDSYRGWNYPALGFRCIVPMWHVLALLLLWPAIRAGKMWRAWLRGRNGLCVNCGYDMRATPGVCPECGVEMKQPQQSPAAYSSPS
jgi:hypothetical protein